jgi:hypothetical protein
VISTLKITMNHDPLLHLDGFGSVPWYSLILNIRVLPITGTQEYPNISFKKQLSRKL